MTGAETPQLFLASPDAAGKADIQKITGTHFLCTKADDDFEMSFDGSSWFKGYRGFKFSTLTPFQKLVFRNPDGGAARSEAIEIEFYAGNVNVESETLFSTRMNHAIETIDPNTHIGGFRATLAAGQTKLFDSPVTMPLPFTIVVGPFKKYQRKQIRFMATGDSCELQDISGKTIDLLTANVWSDWFNTDAVIVFKNNSAGNRDVLAAVVTYTKIAFETLL